MTELDAPVRRVRARLGRRVAVDAVLHVVDRVDHLVRTAPRGVANARAASLAVAPEEPLVVILGTRVEARVAVRGGVAGSGVGRVLHVLLALLEPRPQRRLVVARQLPAIITRRAG